jgi:hypothetical protein
MDIRALLAAMLDRLCDLALSLAGWIIIVGLALTFPDFANGIPRFDIVRIISDMVSRVLG